MWHLFTLNILLDLFLTDTSFFKEWLVSMSRRHLLFWGSVCQRSRSKGSNMWNLFQLNILLIINLSQGLHFIVWLVCISRRPHLDLGKVGQWSRSQGSIFCSFPFIIFQTVCHWYFLNYGIVFFWVSGSNVKGIGVRDNTPICAQYLVNYFQKCLPLIF